MVSYSLGPWLILLRTRVACGSVEQSVFLSAVQVALDGTEQATRIRLLFSLLHVTLLSERAIALPHFTARISVSFLRNPLACIDQRAAKTFDK